MANRKIIYSEALFQFRHDTASNWAAANPVLLAGEFGVVEDGTESEKVKIGDGVTTWNELSWWKGPKGDKGDIGEAGPQGERGAQGPQGDTGPQGIQGLKGDKGDDYVLTDENMQEIASLVNLPVVDQTFDSSSKNAVSGKVLGEVVGSIDQYIYDTGIEATKKANNYTDSKIAEKVGDIETALDSIIAIQNSLIGGDAE